jgi:hypothetical protein
MVLDAKPEDMVNRDAVTDEMLTLATDTVDEDINPRKRRLEPYDCSGATPRN